MPHLVILAATAVVATAAATARRASHPFRWETRRHDWKASN